LLFVDFGHYSQQFAFEKQLASQLPSIVHQRQFILTRLQYIAVIDSAITHHCGNTKHQKNHCTV